MFHTGGQQQVKTQRRNKREIANSLHQICEVTLTGTPPLHVARACPRAIVYMMVDLGLTSQSLENDETLGEKKPLAERTLVQHLD